MRPEVSSFSIGVLEIGVLRIGVFAQGIVTEWPRLQAREAERLEPGPTAESSGRVRPLMGLTIYFLPGGK